MKKITAKRKPRKCEQCGSTKIANIFYGYPSISTKLDKAIQEGRIVLGGCVITECDPNWKCVDCGLQIYKNEKFKCSKCGNVYYSISNSLRITTLCSDCKKIADVESSHEK